MLHDADAGHALPWVYIALVLSYTRFQRRFADHGRRCTPKGSSSYQPAVDVIVPCHNEEPDLLASCLRSLCAQDYRGQVNVWVVDDGSHNRDALLPVLEAEADPTWQICLLGEHQGKRGAQDAALWAGRAEIVLTIDSDTTIDPDGIRRIVAPLREADVGAVTGDVRPSNPETSWLTRLIDVRYRLLFERERAAQGFFGAVLCCAGPFSAYRRTVIERVWPGYIGQRFWGGRRVFGDDLKLTNLVLAGASTASCHSSFAPPRAEPLPRPRPCQSDAPATHGRRWTGRHRRRRAFPPVEAAV